MQPALAALLKGTVDQFAAGGIEPARLDAEILLAHALGCSRMELLTRMAVLAPDEERRFATIAARRLAGEPVAYITGYQAFWNHDFLVNEHTLIPRQDTETLVEVALKHMSSEGRILDLGTGTGCILLSLLDERPSMTGVGVDISADALGVATQNAERLGLADRAVFVESDWFGALAGSQERFSVIVSNPPYIPSPDIEIVMAAVREHEPLVALDGGLDGLRPYRLITETAPSFLDVEGLLAVEVGILQSNDVADLFEKAGLENVQIMRDFPGVERVVSGRKTKNL